MEQRSNYLDENGFRLFKERYAKVGEDDWDDLCHRVSGYICGDDEPLKNKINQGLLNRDFLFNSPALMNAGTPLAQLSACITGDTLVYTKSGLKPMSEIVVGDLVLTHKNRFRKVTTKWDKGIKDTMELSFGTKNRKYYNLRCTPDHKIYSSEEDWVEAKDLIEAKLPTLWESDIAFSNKLCLSSYAEGTKKSVEIDDEGYVRFLNKDKQHRTPKYNEQSTKCFDLVINDKNLAFVFGEYLANGNIDGNALRFTLNSSDLKQKDRIKKMFHDYFGVEINECKSNQGNWTTLRVDNIFIKNLFLKEFGCKFNTKCLPEWICNAPEEYKKALLEGILEDAQRKETSSLLTLANPTLVYQSLLLARSVGLEGNFTANAENKLSKHATSRCSIGNSPKFSQVLKRLADKEHVYDIEVEEDHSFVAGDFIVHNCFKLAIKEDSMRGIFEAISDMAEVQKCGGGTGFNFSILREKNSEVSTTKGKASGVVSFMRVFNSGSKAVEQGGIRRGANMGVIDDDHPDMMDTIEYKRKNNKRIEAMKVLCKDDPEMQEMLENSKELTYFNISVGAHDEFMKKVKDYAELGIDSEWKFISRKNGEVHHSMMISEAWNRICENAHASGDPGVLFIDTINKFNPIPSHPMNGSNPCVTGDTRVQTVEGLIKIKDLVGIEIDVYCMNENGELNISRAHNIRKTRENAELIRITTNRGELLCTPDHKIFTRTRGYVEAKDLVKSDKLVGLNRKMQGEKYCAVALTNTKYIKEHRFIMSHYEDIIGKDIHHKDEDSLHNVKSNLESMSHSGHSVLTNLGHDDWTNRDDKGQYVAKEVKSKKTRLKLSDQPNYTRLMILSVEKVDFKEDVYDLEVDKFHNFVANGIIIHNCGEQVLEDYESCNLASLNIYNFLWLDKNDFVDVNWGKLEQAVRALTRAMDKILDINYFPLQEIKDVTLSNRKLGLGVMGISDALYLSGIRYGSKKAVKWCKRLMEFITGIAMNESRLMGEELGNFPNWDISIYAETNTPMRNATRTTIAPTGSISMLAGCSSGIEPVFGLAYERDVKETHGDGKYSVQVVNKPFADELRKRGLYTTELIHKVALNGGSCQGIDEIPKDVQRVFITAFDVTTKEHLDMQVAFQDYTDNAVSKTINLPSSATVADVSEVYLYAWKNGLKGVTVYRDGSLDSQVLNLVKEDKSPEEVKHEFNLVKPRPVLTDSYTVKLHSGCCDMNATVGFDDESKLFEARISNAGAGCSAMYAGLGMMTSEALRLGGDPQRIAGQLRQVVCPACIGKEGLHGKSCPDILGKLIQNVTKGRGAVQEYVTQGKIKFVSNKPVKFERLRYPDTEDSNVYKQSVYDECPKCGKKTYAKAGGCGVCIECGYSSCG